MSGKVGVTMTNNNFTLKEQTILNLVVGAFKEENIETQFYVLELICIFLYYMTRNLPLNLIRKDVRIGILIRILSSSEFWNFDRDIEFITFNPDESDFLYFQQNSSSLWKKNNEKVCIIFRKHWKKYHKRYGKSIVVFKY